MTALPTMVTRAKPWWLALAAWCLAFCLMPATWAAEATPGDVLPVPALSGHVIDQTQTLSAEQARALDNKLTAFEKTRGTQLVVLIVPTTQPEDIAAYAQRVGDTWKIGRKDVGDGIILLVAKQDRRVRIEVAKALEGAVPDLAASQIIERAITPAFKAGDFAGGLQQGVDHLIARIEGENLPLPSPPANAPGQRDGGGFEFNDLLVFGLIGVPILSGVLGSIFGRKAGALATGFVGGGLAWVVTSSLLIGLGAWAFASLLALAFGQGGRGGHGGWGGPPMGGGWGGGWGGGSGGGGGWSSGGGGDFGGGGASGRW